jgi:hypothetical protein
MQHLIVARPQHDSVEAHAMWHAAVRLCVAKYETKTPQLVAYVKSRKTTAVEKLGVLHNAFALE